MLKIIKQCCDFEELYKNSWGYDWEYIYRQIGMPNYDDDEEEE